jgi:hypothetical protein
VLGALVLALGGAGYLYDYHELKAASASSDATKPPLPYYNLEKPQTVLVQDQSWETSPPHTLSVVRVNNGGYAYWGYYGLVYDCGGVGLVRSNDLKTWTKYKANPLFLNGRWPSVLKVGATFYMLYTKDFCATSYINLAISADGITFTDRKTIVQPESGFYNQNPDLFYDPKSREFYIYWYRGNGADTWDIKARSAVNIVDLDNASSEVVVLHSNSVLAAPNVLYYDNTYFLSTEIKDTKNQWNIKVYASASSPTGGFYPLPGRAVSVTDAACLFQNVFDGTLHGYICKRTNSTWAIEHRTADLAASRFRFPISKRTIGMFLAIGLVLGLLSLLPHVPSHSSDGAEQKRNRYATNS